MPSRRGFRLWKLLFIVSYPMMGISAYLWHDAVYPGRGLLRYFMDAKYRASHPLESGDYTHINSLEYWYSYYIPFAIGVLLTLLGVYLKRRERVPRHVFYDEMDDDGTSL